MNSVINKASYPICCQIIDESIFFIKDVKGDSCVITNHGDYDIKVINLKNKNISFLKIDKCIFDDSDNEKCDCLLASEEIFYFAEVKELEDFNSHSKKSKKRKKACNQLINTINKFKIMHPEINLKKVNAVIVLTPKFEDNYIKIISSKDQIVIDKFVESCGCPNVLEGNLLVFN